MVFIRLVFLNTLFVLTLSANILEYFEKGVFYSTQGREDWKEAKKYFTKSCNTFYGKGCFELAQLYAKGLGVKADPIQATQLYSKACDLDSNKGCLYFGIAYENALGGMPRDYLLAQEQYEEACDMQNGGACAKLGIFHLENRALPSSSPQKAQEYLEKACALHSGLGCIRLRYLNTQTVGTPQEYQKAITLYKEKCSAFYKEACLYLGIIYSQDKVVKKDLKEAVFYLEKACRFNNFKACQILSDLYNQHNNRGATKIYAQRATEILTILNQSLPPPVEYNLSQAQEYEERGVKYAKGIEVPKDETKAYALYKEACTLGNAKGCYRAAQAHIEAKGVKQDNIQANRYFKKACYRGYSYGCSALGFLYQYGEGIDVDIQRAYRYYNRACSLGNDGGCRLKKEIL